MIVIFTVFTILVVIRSARSLSKMSSGNGNAPQTTNHSASCKAIIQRNLRWLMQKIHSIIHVKDRPSKNAEEIPVEKKVKRESSARKSVKFSVSPSFIASVIASSLHSTQSQDEIASIGEYVISPDATHVGEDVQVSLDLEPAKTRINYADREISGEDSANIFFLPTCIRRLIYSYLNDPDIHSLRLTSSAIKEDLESVHGICQRVHDALVDHEETLSKGISKLYIDQFIRTGVNYSTLLPRPDLLKALIISGPITPTHLEFFLDMGENLEELQLTFKQPIQETILLGVKAMTLCRLKILRINSVNSAMSECPIVLNSVKSILNEISMPRLNTFEIKVVACMPFTLRSYHLAAYRFIEKCVSLKSVAVFLRMVENADVAAQREDILLINAQLGSSNKLSSLSLNINNNNQVWYSLLDSQTCLQSLLIHINGQLWNRLILVLDRNATSLKSLSVSDLCSTAHDGITTVPVDLGLLRNSCCLEVLKVEQIDLNIRGLESPEVLRVSSLPPSIKHIRLCHLKLQPHQAMYIMLKLPQLVQADLECWTDSEATLANFLCVIAFLIKFDMTPVKVLSIGDVKRRMENQEGIVNKLVSALSKKATVSRSHSELYSYLDITIGSRRVY